MKKLFAVLMAMLIVFSICVPSFAVEIDNTNTSGNAIATYEANSSFKVTIPTYIAPSEKGETASANMYSVTASDVFIPDGNQLTVTVDYDGVLTDRNGVEIPYKLFSGGSEVTNGQKIIAKDAGNPDDTATVNFSAAVQAEPRYAGTYTDTVKFNISVEEKPYTIEEINADEHLIAIGKTEPEYVVAKFNDDYSDVTIFKNGSESDGEMKEWSYSDKSPFTEKAETLKRATIKSGVTNISNHAFYTCALLSNVTIPDSIIKISDFAFGSCDVLTNITIPNSVIDIGYCAFYRCKSLTDIKIPESVKSIGISAFDRCTSLTRVIILEGVTSIGRQAFGYCESLTSITIPDSVTSIGRSAFLLCGSLESVIIGNSVTSLEYATFQGCTSLTDIIIPNSVTSIKDNVFTRCISLKNITLPNSVTSIGNQAFTNCESLTKIAIPYGVTSIGNEVFQFCKSLKNITIPDSVTNIGSDILEYTAYYDTEDNWENVVLYVGNHLIKAKNTLSGEYVIKDCTKSIAGSAFHHCSRLTSITIPNGIKSIGNLTFASCVNLKNVAIPSGVTSIGNSAFSDCWSIEDIIIPNSVIEIGNLAFNSCHKLVDVTIPESVTNISSSAFSGSGLKTIYGVSGSYAETFAAEKGYTFIAQS